MKVLVASVFVTVLMIGLVWTDLGIAASASRPVAIPATARWTPTPLPSTPAAAAMPAPMPIAPVAQPAWTQAQPSTAAPPEPVRDPAADPALVGWGRPAAPAIDPRRFTEAHWQGLEVIPKSPRVAQALGLPAEVAGVIVDDVTLPADLQGFQAGDLVTHVGRVPTPDLLAFIEATDAQRDLRATEVQLVRDAQPRTIALTALLDRLGTANGETPSMIPPGARMPHPYRGPCTNCHRIGTTGTLPIDQGDPLGTAAPVIRAGDVRPHRDRGPCVTCHQIVP